MNGGLLFDHTLLWPALAPLARRRELILYDQRGRGNSEPPADQSAARIEHDAGDIPALRVALGLRRWDVLGHSWGGGIAMLGAERDREGTRRLVLVDPVHATSAWMDVVHAAALERLSPADRAVLARFDRETLSRPDPAVQSAYARALYPAWFAKPSLAKTVSLPRSTSATGSAVAARLRREGYDWTPLVRALDSPTIVIHGEQDVLPADGARALTRLVTGSQLAVLPDSGHLPFLESPELFFKLVEDFLSPHHEANPALGPSRSDHPS